MRMKDDYDGAEPAGNSVALMNLLRLAEITDLPDFRTAAERTLSALSSRIAGQPVAVPQMLVALDYSLSPHRQVVLAGHPVDDFLRALRASFQPHTMTFMVDGGKSIEHINPAIGRMKELDGLPTAYVCENYTCQLPTHDVAQFEKEIRDSTLNHHFHG
jgi:hypothetical protein